MSIRQEIRNINNSSIDVAIKYYSILSCLNHLELTDTQIKILAFMATKGAINSGGARELFIQMFGSSKASIANMVGVLKKRGFIVKDDTRRLLVIHPQLQLDFSQSLVLQISIINNGIDAEA